MPEYSNISLGQVVRELREGKGITQVDLGRGARYGTGEDVSISRLENGLLRPSAEKLAGIAETLGLTVEELEARVRERDAANSTTESRDEVAAEQAKSKSVEAKAPPSQKELAARQARIQKEVHERSKLIQDLGDAFNLHYERAFDVFFKRFDDIARRVEGAPPPDPLQLDDDPEATASDTADRWVQSNVNGVVRTLASGATGAAAGAVMGSATAYGTFLAAASFGTASTGAAISGLSGAAATNAALALLGGGTLVTGGAGVAGGAAVLAGIAFAPVAVFAVGGLAIAQRRNRRQRQELADQLDEAEAELAATAPGVEALQDLLPRATATFDYIATHAGHAVARWEDQLDAGPLTWDSLGPDGQQRYQAFADVAGAQVAIATLSFERLLLARDEDDRNALAQLADQVLRTAHDTVQGHV
jgi:transcriptional regulator with XRE-family HTH domain